MLKQVQHDGFVCYILVNLFITLILLCHPEFISGSYQLEMEAPNWPDAETVLNFPYGSGNLLHSVKTF